MTTERLTRVAWFFLKCYGVNTNFRKQKFSFSQFPIYVSMPSNRLLAIGASTLAPIEGGRGRERRPSSASQTWRFVGTVAGQRSRPKSVPVPSSSKKCDEKNHENHVTYVALESKYQLSDPNKKSELGCTPKLFTPTLWIIQLGLCIWVLLQPQRYVSTINFADPMGYPCHWIKGFFLSPWPWSNDPLLWSSTQMFDLTYGFVWK